MTAFKVKLRGPGGECIFQASSPLVESRTANYDGYNIVQLPTDMWAYRNTTARRFTITGKMVSRNKSEAMENIRYLNLVRSWVLPDFGGTGATPPILKLSAYKNKNINNLQCVMKSYSFNFPDDVDFIYDAAEPMPVIATLTIDLDEAYSATEITGKKWKIKLTGGGDFETGEDGTSNSFTVNFGGGGGGGNSSSGGPGIARAGTIVSPILSAVFPGGILGQKPVNLNSTLRNVVSQALIVDATIRTANRFIGGIDPQMVLDRVADGVNDLTTQATNAISDAFGRDDGLEVRPLIGDDFSPFEDL